MNIMSNYENSHTAILILIYMSQGYGENEDLINFLR